MKTTSPPRWRKAIAATVATLLGVGVLSFATALPASAADRFVRATIDIRDFPEANVGSPVLQRITALLNGPVDWHTGDTFTISLHDSIDWTAQDGQSLDGETKDGAGNPIDGVNLTVVAPVGSPAYIQGTVLHDRSSASLTGEIIVSIWGYAKTPGTYTISNRTFTINESPVTYPEPGITVAADGFTYNSEQWLPILNDYQGWHGTLNSCGYTDVGMSMTDLDGTRVLQPSEYTAECVDGEMVLTADPTVPTNGAVTYTVTGKSAPGEVVTLTKIPQPPYKLTFRTTSQSGGGTGSGYASGLDGVKYDGRGATPDVMVDGVHSGFNPGVMVTPTDGDWEPRVDADTQENAAQALAGEAVPVSFYFENIGELSLANITVTDTTDQGSEVQGLTCDFSALGGPSTGTAWAGPLLPGDSFTCEATLTMERNEVHRDYVIAQFQSISPSNTVNPTVRSEQDFFWAETHDIALATPVAPEIVPAETCGVESTVKVTETAGVVYTQVRTGDFVTVTATPADGYAFAEGTVTEWTIEIPEVVLCSVVPIAPTLVPAASCGVEGTVTTPDVTGITYTQTREGNIVTVVATANEGYGIAEGEASSWTFTIPEVVECPPDVVIVTPVAPTLVPAETCGVEATVTTATTEGVTYTQVREGNIIRVNASANDGYAFADGTVTQWDITIPAVEPCETVVTPVAPTLVPAETCGVEATVVPSSTPTPGVIYTQTREGNIVTVVATVSEGYTFAEGAVTEWTFTIPPVEPCDKVVTPFAPSLVPAETCGVEATVVPATTEGVTYTQTREGNIVTVVATVNDGYVLAENAVTEWKVTIPAIEPCDKVATPVAPELVPAKSCGAEPTVATPVTEGVTYSQVRDGNKLTITATSKDGYTLAKGAVTEWVFDLTPENCPTPAPSADNSNGGKDYPEKGNLAQTGADMTSVMWAGSFAVLMLVLGGVSMYRRRTSDI